MKLNIVIDATNLFYRSLYAMGNYGLKKGERLLETRTSQGMFMRKLASDFSYMVRSVEEPARVIICKDMTSWRKSVEMEEIDEASYKGHRTQDESTVAWDSFFDITDKFCDILSRKGYLVSRVPGAEADDLLFFWSQRLNDLGESVILITGDRDLHQVLNLHPNGSWTVAIDPVLKRRRLLLTQETLDSSSIDAPQVADIFSPDSWSSSSDILRKLAASLEVSVVDTRVIKLRKVIMGDVGDNVASVITWLDPKDPTKKRSMTDNNLDKVLAAHPTLAESDWEALREGNFAEEISSVVEALKKIPVDRERVRRNLRRNALLVILDNKTVPQQIHEMFMKIHPEVPDLAPVTTRDGILGGTEWWTSEKESFVPKSYDLFE